MKKIAFVRKARTLNKVKLKKGMLVEYALYENTYLYGEILEFNDNKGILIKDLKTGFGHWVKDVQGSKLNIFNFFFTEIQKLPINEGDYVYDNFQYGKAVQINHNSIVCTNGKKFIPRNVEKIIASTNNELEKEIPHVNVKENLNMAILTFNSEGDKVIDCQGLPRNIPIESLIRFLQDNIDINIEKILPYLKS